MYGISTKVASELQKLRENFEVKGLKAEFEAEGASFRDLVRLRYLTLIAGVKLYVKIGGVEALRDIKDCYELGVDGIIGPMVETKFGAKKFVEGVKSIFKDNSVHLTVNIETRNAIEEIDDIIDYAKGRIHNFTIGRTDLSGSYFQTSVTPDSPFILGVIEEVGAKVRHAGIGLTVGGSLSTSSIKAIQDRPVLQAVIQKLETRKVMIPIEQALRGPDAVREALRFEELYILSKKEISDLMIESDINRLTQLTRRS